MAACASVRRKRLVATRSGSPTGAVQALHKELKSPGPVAFVRADVVAPSPVLAAMELAGDHEPVVFGLGQVAFRRRLQETPVFLVNRR